MIGIQPAGHRILIKPDEELEFNKGGIIAIPDDIKDRYSTAQTTGTLVAVGPTAWSDLGKGEPWAKVGDKIMFAKYAGMIVKGLDGVNYRMLNDEDLVAVLDSDYKLGDK